MELDADEVDYDGDSWDSVSSGESSSDDDVGMKEHFSEPRAKGSVFVSPEGSAFGYFGDSSSGSGSESESGDERCGAQFWGPPPPPLPSTTSHVPVDHPACETHEGTYVLPPSPPPSPPPQQQSPELDAGFDSSSDDEEDENEDDFKEFEEPMKQEEEEEEEEEEKEREEETIWKTGKEGEWPAIERGRTPFVLGARTFRPRGAPCASDEMPLLADCVPGVRSASARGTALPRLALCRDVALVPARLDAGTDAAFLPRVWRAGAELARAFEGPQVEFKRGQHWTHARLAGDVARYANAFVNTRGGVLLYGVSDRGVVEGVPLTRLERDAFSNRASSLLAGFRPSVPPQCFRLLFFPLQNGDDKQDEQMEHQEEEQKQQEKQGQEREQQQEKQSHSQPSTMEEGKKQETRGKISGTYLQARTVAQGSECKSERYVVVFAMLYHKTAESQCVATRENNCFALQRVGSTTAFVNLQFISRQRELAAVEGQEDHDADNPDGCTYDDSSDDLGREQRRVGADVLRRQERALAARQTLPAYRERARIAAAVAGHRVTVVTGPTGSGKSTQLPQIVLEAARGVPACVVVAQPRRLAAMRLAARVAAEMGVALGAEVGYHVGRRRHCDSTTRVLFVTYGILQHYFQRGRALAGVTHIVVDEVHERLVETDVCLALAAMHLRAHPAARLVVMSATVDAPALVRYFRRELPAPAPREPRAPEPVPPPVAVVALAGAPHRVAVAYLDDLVPAPVLARLTDQFVPSRPRLTEAARAAILAIVEKLSNGVVAGSSFSSHSKAATSSSSIYSSTTATETTETTQETSTSETNATIGSTTTATSTTSSSSTNTTSSNAKTKNTPTTTASVLIFLPGIATVLSVYDMLSLSPVASRLALCTLHSSCTEREQRRAMAAAPAGRVKVVLCTNIIESAVTVPDATVVVDTLLARQSRYDAPTRQQVLETVWVSRDSAAQRAGRCGRVAPGTVFRLVPRAFYEHDLAPHNTPEVRRAF